MSSPAEVRERLAMLQRKDKLEKLLAPLEPQFPWADIVSMLQWPTYLAIAIHGARMASAAKATDASPPPESLAWLLLLALLSQGFRWGAPLLRSRRERLRRKLRREGELVPAAIVMANDAWHDEGNTEWLPGAAVVSFDPTAWKQADRLTLVAKCLFALRAQDRRTLPPPHAELAWDLYHELGPLPSRAVPFELSEGLRDCWLVSVKMPPQPLQVLGMPAALALPGESSPDAVSLLPQSVVASG
jgi:hypothetical protein